MTRTMRVLTTFLFALLLVLVMATSAGATFPGENGRIAFSQGDLLAPIGGEPGDFSTHSQVFTVRPDGSGLRRLTDVGRREGAGSPDWSPDGKRIAYISNQTGSFQIWVMNADGTHQHQVTHGSRFEGFQPSWSPDGERILFSRCSNPLGFFFAFCDIAVIDADGTDLETLLREGHWFNVRAVYSPDGKWIAFGSDRGGRQSAIWVMEADGDDPERLTPTALRAFWPDWSPDGERILFSDNCCLPHSNLWTVHPDGDQLKRLTDVPQDLDAAFGSYSPDGEKIVTFFTRGCGGGPCDHFFTLRSDGTGFHQVPAKPNTFLTDWGAKAAP